jgi:hypothetical protein
MMTEFTSPERLTLWSLRAMAELGQSIYRDLKEKQLFAFLTRIRQPEELYIRTLYALFIAEQEVLPHLVSGDLPNGLSSMYEQVNKIVLNNRGALLVAQPGLRQGTFKPMDLLNDGTHVSFRAILTHHGWMQNPQLIPITLADEYDKHIRQYCENLKSMHEMFKAGQDREQVLAAVQDLHKYL